MILNRFAGFSLVCGLAGELLISKRGLAREIGKGRGVGDVCRIGSALMVKPFGGFAFIFVWSFYFCNIADNIVVLILLHSCHVF